MARSMTLPAMLQIVIDGKLGLISIMLIQFTEGAFCAIAITSMNNFEYYSKLYKICAQSPELMAADLIIDIPLPNGGSVFQTPNGHVFKTYAGAYDYMVDFWLTQPH